MDDQQRQELARLGREWQASEDAFEEESSRYWKPQWGEGIIEAGDGMDQAALDRLAELDSARSAALKAWEEALRRLAED